MTTAIIIFGLLGAYAIVAAWVFVEVARYFGKDANDDRNF